MEAILGDIAFFITIENTMKPHHCINQIITLLQLIDLFSQAEFSLPVLPGSLIIVGVTWESQS